MIKNIIIIILLLIVCLDVLAQQNIKKFYVTGLYRTKECNDQTLPVIISYGSDRVDALVHIRGVTVWTEEEWKENKDLK